MGGTRSKIFKKRESRSTTSTRSAPHKASHSTTPELPLELAPELPHSKSSSSTTSITTAKTQCTDSKLLALLTKQFDKIGLLLYWDPSQQKWIHHCSGWIAGHKSNKIITAGHCFIYPKFGQEASTKDAIDVFEVFKLPLVFCPNWDGDTTKGFLGATGYPTTCLPINEFAIFNGWRELTQTDIINKANDFYHKGGYKPLDVKKKCSTCSKKKKCEALPPKEQFDTLFKDGVYPGYKFMDCQTRHFWGQYIMSAAPFDIAIATVQGPLMDGFTIKNPGSSTFDEPLNEYDIVGYPGYYPEKGQGFRKVLCISGLRADEPKFERNAKFSVVAHTGTSGGIVAESNSEDEQVYAVGVLSLNWGDEGFIHSDYMPYWEYERKRVDLEYSWVFEFSDEQIIEHIEKQLVAKPGVFEEDTADHRYDWIGARTGVMPQEIVPFINFYNNADVYIIYIIMLLCVLLILLLSCLFVSVLSFVFGLIAGYLGGDYFNDKYCDGYEKEKQAGDEKYDYAENCV